VNHIRQKKREELKEPEGWHISKKILKYVSKNMGYNILIVG
jgi:hypothetical protein